MMDGRKLNIDAPLMSVRRSYNTPSPSLTEAKRKISKKQQALPYKTLDQVTEPAAVPFNWEHIPGRSKGNGGSHPQPPKNTSIAPTPSLPPGKSTKVSKHQLEKEPLVANKFSSNSFSDSVGNLHCEKEQKDAKVRNLEEDDDDNDYDDVYSDAVETLSPTEPFSMNCSVSGVSGMENLDANKCGTSSTDKQTQDFMMNRFLSAAKAMTLQPPQYASRKKSSQAEQQLPRNFTKLVHEEKKSFVNRHITDIVPYTGQFQEEEEESDDENDDCEDISAKGCGLFPSLCVKNSLCLLNQVPGTKMENQFSMYSSYEVGKHNKSSNIHSYKPAPAIKKAWDAIHKSKPSSGAESQNLLEVRKKWTSESNRYSKSGELKQLGRLSPFRRSRAVTAESNQSGRLKFLSRGHASVHEVLSQGAKKSSNLRTLKMEKTLYLDAAGTLKLSCSNSSSLGSSTTQNRVTSSSFRDMKRVQVQTLDKRLDSEVLNSTDNNSSTLSTLSCLMEKEDKAERLTIGQENNQETMSLQLVQSSFNKDKEINNQQIVVVDDSTLQHPLPPPLPKSPSESWLCRALPLVSSKNSFSHLNQSKRQGLSRASSFTKWETIVKTSNLHHDHVCCSQELTIYQSQYSKS